MWVHQQEGVDFSVDRRDVILHMGMGTGKTRTCLEAIKQEEYRRILVCCPKAVIPAWRHQVRLWLGEDYRVLLLTKGTSKAKEKQIAESLESDKPIIVVVNYESAWRIPLIEKTKWDCLVYDECHRLKSPSGKTSRWAARMGKKNPKCKRFGLSGTLLAHSPLDAYGVYRAMESPECETFGNSYTIFRSRYAITNPHLPGMVIGYRNTKQFSDLIAKTSFHRRSEDVLDLPDIMHNEIIVPMTQKEGRLYQEIETDCCAAIEGEGNVTPANVLVQLTRLLQICGGHVCYDEEKVAVPVDKNSSKPAAVQDLLTDLPKDEPVVIFCRYRAELDALLAACKKVDRSASELSGRANQLEDWQQGKTNVLIANTQSGGIGIDLTRSSYCIFYSLGHSLADYLQAIARLHRPGQEKTTHFYSLVAETHLGKRTVDKSVYEALSNRKEVIDDIITRKRFS